MNTLVNFQSAQPSNWSIFDRRQQGVLIYGSISLALVIGASLFAYSYFKEHGSDGHSHSHGTPAPLITQAMKEVRIEVDDTMRFSPAIWEAQAGEPIRIILVNKGKVDHELVIGTEKEIVAHAKEMASPGAKGHHHTNEISAKPGQQAELVWTFKKPGQYAMACFEPGHYEAGMKGVINVVAEKR